MKIYPDKTECPPVTEAQRAELIKRVREGTMNWINSLMTRAGVTPEECATPRLSFLRISCSTSWRRGMM